MLMVVCRTRLVPDEELSGVGLEQPEAHLETPGAVDKTADQPLEL